MSLNSKIEVLHPKLQPEDWRKLTSPMYNIPYKNDKFIFIFIVEIMSVSNGVHEMEEIFKFGSIAIKSALLFKVVGRSFHLGHNHFFQTQVFHPFLKANHFVVGLSHCIVTKLNIISSSVHLLLPVPWSFQQSVSLVKYSVGMRGR